MDRRIAIGGGDKKGRDVQSYAQPQASPEREGRALVRYSMGEQASQAGVGFVVPPSATTFNQFRRLKILPKRLRGTRQIGSATVHVASQASCRCHDCLPCFAFPSASTCLSYRACTRPTKRALVDSLRAYCGGTPGETRRSYRLQGSKGLTMSLPGPYMYVQRTYACWLF
jgi:hypothetical protein